jgi:DNA-binding beta-propeller fold protein YncE
MSISAHRRTLARRRPGLLIAVLALLALALPASAGAAIHPLLGVVAAGKPLPTAPFVKPFDNPCGLAVDSAGRFYVSDYQHRVIHVFDVGGGYITEFPSGSDAEENSSCGLAVGSGGQVYANLLDQGVGYHTPSFPSYSAATPFDSGRATGVAVDPASDRVYVAHRDRVLAYEADGTLLPLEIGAGTGHDYYGLAVSGFAANAGFVYVGDAADDTVKVFDPLADPDTPVLTIDGAGNPQGGFSDLTATALALDASNGHVFVVDNLQPGFEHPAAAIDEFDLTGAYVGRLPGAMVHGGPTGIAIDNSINGGTGKPEGVIYATTGNESGGVVNAFCPAEPQSTGMEEACAGAAPGEFLKVVRAGSGEGEVRSVAQRIDCGVLCATEVEAGAVVTLVATPRPHSAFAGWSVAGNPAACPGLDNCKVTVADTSEVTATFNAIPQRTLTVSKPGSGAGIVTSSPGGIDCGATCAAGFDQGATVTLTAEAAVGSEFTGWSGAGCSGTGACKVVLGSDAAVSAGFRTVARPPAVVPASSSRTLAISVTGAGAGTIVSEPAGIDCGAPCSGSYAPGTTVALVAKPDAESHFVGWSGCDSVAGARCTVRLDSSRTVGAAFAEGAPRRPCKRPKRAGAKRGDRAASSKRKPAGGCRGKQKNKAGKRGKGR